MKSELSIYAVLIKEAHLDTFAHVNNAAYLTLFEEARWNLMNNNGYTLLKIKETGLGPTILELKLRFMKELRLGDKIIIETELVSYQKKIFKLEQRMLRDKELCCLGEFTCALFDMKERKLIAPTVEWLKGIGCRA